MLTTDNSSTGVVVCSCVTLVNDSISDKGKNIIVIACIVLYQARC